MDTDTGIPTIVRSVMSTLLILSAAVSPASAQPRSTLRPTEQPTPGASEPERRQPRPLRSQRHFTFAVGASMERTSWVLSSCNLATLTHLYSGKSVPLAGIAEAMLDAPVSSGETRAKADFPTRAARGIGASPARKMDATFLAIFKTPKDAACAEEGLRRERLVTHSATPYEVHFNQDPSDQYSSQAAYGAIPASMGFDRSYMKALEPVLPRGVTLRSKPIVAIVDSGVALDHPDLRGAVLTNKREIPGNRKDDDRNGLIDDYTGGNFACRGDAIKPECRNPSVEGDIRDSEGHGTHVAGIAVGRGAVTGGVRGVAPTAALIPVRVADSLGSSTSGIAAAIRYATDRGADAINLSLGWEAPPTELDGPVHDAVTYARANGTVVVFAAGNEESIANTAAVCNLPEPICVSASWVSTNSLTQDTPRRANILFADFSNYGGQVDITAPGVDIVSTVPCLQRKDDETLAPEKCSFPQDFYKRASGTSMAAPHVTALAALIAAVNPRLNPDQIKSVIQITAVDAFEPGYDGLGGAGLLNIRGALQWADDIYTGRRSPPPTIRVIEPLAATRVREGVVIPFGFEVSSVGRYSYTFTARSIISGKVVISQKGSAPTARLHSVSVDSKKLGSGMFLVEVSVTDLAGTTVREWRDIEVRPWNQSPEIDPLDDTIGPEGSSLSSWLLEAREHNGRMWTLQLQTAGDPDGGTLNRLLREQFLTFSPLGVKRTSAKTLGENADENLTDASFMRYSSDVCLWTRTLDPNLEPVGFATLDRNGHGMIPDPDANSSYPEFNAKNFQQSNDYAAGISRDSLLIRKGPRGKFVALEGLQPDTLLLDAATQRLFAYSSAKQKIIEAPLGTQGVQQSLANGSYPAHEIKGVPFALASQDHLRSLLDVDGVSLLLTSYRADDLDQPTLESLQLFNLQTRNRLHVAATSDSARGEITAAIHGSDVYYTKIARSIPFFGTRPVFGAFLHSLSSNRVRVLLLDFNAQDSTEARWIKLANGTVLMRGKYQRRLLFHQYEQSLASSTDR